MVGMLALENKLKKLEAQLAVFQHADIVPQFVVFGSDGLPASYPSVEAWQLAVMQRVARVICPIPHAMFFLPAQQAAETTDEEKHTNIALPEFMANIVGGNAGMGKISYHDDAFLALAFPGTEDHQEASPDDADEASTALTILAPNPIVGPAPARPAKYDQLRLPVMEKPPLDLSAPDGNRLIDGEIARESGQDQQITNPDLTNSRRGQGLLAHDDETTAAMLAARPKSEPAEPAQPVLSVGPDGLTEYERLYGRGRTAPVWRDGKFVEHAPAKSYVDTIVTDNPARPLLKPAPFQG